MDFAHETIWTKFDKAKSSRHPRLQNYPTLPDWLTIYSKNCLLYHCDENREFGLLIMPNTLIETSRLVHIPTRTFLMRFSKRLTNSYLGVDSSGQFIYTIFEKSFVKHDIGDDGETFEIPLISEVSKKIRIPGSRYYQLLDKLSIVAKSLAQLIILYSFDEQFLQDSIKT